MKVKLEEKLEINNNSTNEELHEVPEIGFFEGTEKLLEIWFHQRDSDECSDDGDRSKKCDLRDIPRYVSDHGLISAVIFHVYFKYTCYFEYWFLIGCCYLLK